MTAPLIGITTYRKQDSGSASAFSTSEDYVRAVAQAGGIPVLVPLGLSEADLEALLERLDGVLLSGGGDVLPERYGSPPHPRVAGVDVDRDRVEITLLNRVIERQKPFLGICRGIQVINVALGGSLYEDLLDQRPDTLNHDQDTPEHPRDFLAHAVTLTKGSRLGAALGAAHPVALGREEYMVNSLHHQGIRRLAEGLAVTAHAPDGVIEGVELEGYPFGLAVQWHPECLQAHEPMRALFREFVWACR